jgi:protein dithiol oxidoreductase (disulfide-forming)
MRRLTSWLSAFALGVVAAAASAQPFEAGKDYVVLETPVQTSGESVEVREFFSYGCPHCFTFVTPMHAWLDKRAPENVRYVRTPVVFNESWRPLAQAYHAAEVLDVVEQVHVPLFGAIHNERKRFRNLEELADFFASQGTDRAEFLRTAQSFAVDVRLRQSNQAMRAFRIDSTPSVGVAGKYMVNPRTAGSHERMIQIIEHLVRLESEAAG